MDENEEGPPTPQPQISRKTRRALRKEAGQDDSPRPQLPDPEGAHKKFMAIMIGLFLLALILMIVFNEYMDFAVDGGI